MSFHATQLVAAWNSWARAMLIGSLMFCGSGASLSSLHAALVVLKNNAEPVMGRIVRENAQQIVVRGFRPDGTLHEQTIPREKIAEIIATVSPQRLESLTPDQPEAYLSYAEELAVKKKDWDAQDTALRLYSIALTRQRATLGIRALKGMNHLTNSPQAAQRYALALALLDPQANPANLQPKGKALDSPENQTLATVLETLPWIRQGKGAEAKPILSQPQVTKFLRDYEAILTRNELDMACQEKQLAPRQLRQLLILELTLESRQQSASFAAQGNTPWSAEISMGGNAPVPFIDWEHLTEFDPRETLYRQGKWVKE